MYILPIAVKKDKPINKTAVMLTRMDIKKNYQPSNGTSKNGEKVPKKK